jgi:hypothetical protein
MLLNDADRDLILNALFDYGMVYRDRSEGIRAQNLYLRLNGARAFHFTVKPTAPGINAASERQRA